MRHIFTMTMNGNKKTGVFHRLFTQVPEEYRALLKKTKLETNITRAFILSIYLIIVQIVLNVINMLKPSDSKSSDINIYVLLSMLLLLVGIIYFILLCLVRKGKIKRAGFQQFLVQSLLYIYLIVQMIFCTLNIISTGGMNSYIIAILIVGLFPILSPAQSLISIGGTFLYLIGAIYFTRNISDTWNSIMISDMWANLIIITGIVMCISILIYQMYVSNFLQSVRLQESNEQLRKANNALGVANDKLEVLANTDQMTGISNRRALDRVLNEAWQNAIITQNHLAIAVFDIDFLKDYKDTFGHLEGDHCLQMVASCLHNSFRRDTDFVSRYGGEEFLVVFSADATTAYDMVEQARKNIEALQIQHATDKVSAYVTISAGVCVAIPSQDLSTDKAVDIADKALYASKQTGRNKTTLSLYEDDA